MLPVALGSLRGTTLRSLALAATGAVALFGAVALGGARADLLRGIAGFAHSYAADADIWVGAPGDNQATVDFRAGGLAQRIAQIPGSPACSAFQGGFVNSTRRAQPAVLDARRAPPRRRGAASARQPDLMDSGQARDERSRTLGEGGWVAVSAADRRRAAHVGVGGTLALPTPSGARRRAGRGDDDEPRLEPGRDLHEPGATTAACGRAPRRPRSPCAWRPAPTRQRAAGRCDAALGPASGLQATSARDARSEHRRADRRRAWPAQEISTLLLLAAILAMAAALSSAIWQRRVSLATLRLSGVRPRADAR